jgi:hypothetical protein
MGNTHGNTGTPAGQREQAEDQLIPETRARYR